MAADDAAVVVRLQANLKDYEAALKSAVRATERAATAAEKAISNVGKTGGAGNVIQANFQKSAGAIANDARVLQFQLNDIFSGIASGQGIRAVQQQLGQIAQQLSGGGMAQGARTLGAALYGMINPINLAVVVFGTLATVAAAYFTSAEKDAEDATKELEKQADTLEKLADKYGKIFPELERAADKLREQADAAGLAMAKQKALAAAYEDTQKALKGMDTDIGEIVSLLEAMGATPEMIAPLQKAFQDLSAAIDKNKASSADAKTVVEGLNVIIANGAGRVVTLATAIRDQLVKSFEELDRAAGSAAETIQKTLAFPLPGAGGPLDLGPLKEAAAKTPSAARDLLRSRAASKEIADSLEHLTDDMAQALAKLFAILPDTARITSGVRSRAEQARLYADYVSGRGGLAAPPGRSRHEVGRAVDIGAGVDMETLRRAVLQVKELEQLKGRAYQVDKVHVQLAGTARALDEEAADAAVKTAEEQARAAERRAEADKKAQENLVEYLSSLDEQASLANRINEINANATLTADQKAIAVAVETELQNALNTAQQNNITLTEQQIEQIRLKATANAQAALGAKAIADAERQAAVDAKARTDALKQFNQQAAQVVAGGLSSFINDLVAGKDAGDAFASALQRITSQLIDMMVQMLIIKPMMNALGGGFGGGFGGGGGGLFEGGGTVGMSGRHDGRKFSPALWAGAPRFATGGIVGLRPGEVPIIAHRGEYIVPNARRMAGSGGGRIDNSVHQQNRISIDMQGSGYVAANSQNAKQVGENMQKIIQAELVRESRPGGLLRRVPG